VDKRYGLNQGNEGLLLLNRLVLEAMLLEWCKWNSFLRWRWRYSAWWIRGEGRG